jgi:glycosyltransferase involved in cell wall biosynthesis
LLLQSLRPAHIIVVDDHSATPPKLPDDPCIHLVHPDKKGRASARNLGISTALGFTDVDAIVFMDGDTTPESIRFLEHHAEQHGKRDATLHFGMRRHVPRPKDIANYNSFGEYEATEVALYPSDLLTGNMDNLALGKPMDYQDLRILSGALAAWKAANTFGEYCDLLLSGMVSWSCNFSMSRSAATSLHQFLQDTYKVDGWFDDTMFNDGWGYEDVAMGLDALFAGIEITLGESATVQHLMHDRSDQLSSHVLGRHRIMERYRKLFQSRNRGSAWEQLDAVLMAGGLSVGLTRKEVTVNGRSFPIPASVKLTRPRNTLFSLRGKIYVNGHFFNIQDGTFHKSTLGNLLDFFLK